MSQKVVQVMLVLYEILTQKVYVYALADDLVNILRSDDQGSSWKFVPATEFTTVRNFTEIKKAQIT